MAKIDAVKAAQRLLISAWPKTQVDGIWGSKTESVYQSSKAGLKEQVADTLREFGQTVESVRSKQVTEMIEDAKESVDAPTKSWLSQAEAYEITRAAASEFGVDGSVMLKFLNLEAETRSGSSGKEYNAQSVAPNKLFRGLFQMGRPAWSDVRGQIGVGYDKVFDPVANARAAAAYINANMRFARSKGYNGQFTAEVLYAMHNQGAGGFMRLIRERKANSNTRNQSRAAQAVITAALAQNGVLLA
jgi:hypothetical protein